MNENKDDFLASWRKDLEKDLDCLKKEKEEEIKKYKLETIQILEKKQEKKITELESKIKKFYYWLFSIALVILLIMGGMFFYLQNSFGK